MRGWDREDFDTVWGGWNPADLAIIDPNCCMNWSILLVDIIAGEALEQQKRALSEHYLWLMESGGKDELKDWNKMVEKCKSSGLCPDQKLINFIVVAENLPVFEGADIDDGLGLWGAASQARIKEYCKSSHPELFATMISNDAWRAVVNKAKKHMGKIPNARAGRPCS